MSNTNMIKKLEIALKATIHEELEKRTDEIIEELVAEFEERLYKEKMAVINNVVADMMLFVQADMLGQKVEFVVKHKVKE